MATADRSLIPGYLFHSDQRLNSEIRGQATPTRGGMGPDLPQLRPSFLPFRTRRPGHHAHRHHAAERIVVDRVDHAGLDDPGRSLPGGVGGPLFFRHPGWNLDRGPDGVFGSVGLFVYLARCEILRTFKPPEIYKITQRPTIKIVG